MGTDTIQKNENQYVNYNGRDVKEKKLKRNDLIFNHAKESKTN